VSALVIGYYTLEPTIKYILLLIGSVFTIPLRQSMSHYLMETVTAQYAGTLNYSSTLCLTNVLY